MDGDALRTLAIFVPFLALAATALIWTIRVRPANVAADEAAHDGQWKRMAAWNERLQEEVEACHRERDEARAEAIKWKMIAEGGGQMRQDAAIAAASERLAEQEEKRERGK